MFDTPEGYAMVKLVEVSTFELATEVVKVVISVVISLAKG